jgi:predicted transcriptional regulator
MTANKKKRRVLEIDVKSSHDAAMDALRVMKQIDQGKPIQAPIERLHFGDLQTMLKFLTPKRLELLRKLHAVGPCNIRQLAQALERDYKNVYQDVSELSRIGLIEEVVEGISVPWNEIVARLPLSAGIVKRDPEARAVRRKSAGKKRRSTESMPSPVSKRRAKTG